MKRRALLHSFGSLFLYISTNSIDCGGLLKENCPLFYSCNPVVVEKGKCSSSYQYFKLNCIRDKEMDVSASALVDGITECSNEKETMDMGGQRELSIYTLLMHFANEFDPYGALSTPLYQKATFKQDNIICKQHTSRCFILDMPRQFIPDQSKEVRAQSRKTKSLMRQNMGVTIIQEVEILLELDKVDRALCFTSGMNALSAVTHLVGTDCSGTA